MLLVSVPIVLERAKSSIFYRTGIFGNFFFGGRGILRFQNGNSRWPCHSRFILLNSFVF